MLLHKQTIFSNTELGTFGNCTQACIATLLQLPLDAVPHFLVTGETDAYWTAIDNFLIEHNLQIVDSSTPLRVILSDFDCYHLIGGPSPRGKGLFHHIVGKNGEPFFDPHPDNTMLLGTPKDWCFEYLVRTIKC